jgi:hypothetical protein
MSNTIELKDDPTAALERKATSALSSKTASAADLAALIEETKAVIADAEKEQAVDPSAADPRSARQAMDAMVAINRLGPLLLRLQARYRELHEQEQIVTWLAEREATWLAEHDALKGARDALADELRDVYPAAARKIADLFERIAANDKAADELKRTRPEGVQRHLRSVELHARGLDSFCRDTPSLLSSVCLFDWDTGRQICPPPRQSMGAAFAATMMPASDRRFSGDWWEEREQGAGRQRAEQQRIADTYSRMTMEQEDRENAEARERFAAHQPKKSV